MLKNLIIVSLRNISKDRIYSVINIFGLTVGISCSILLLFIVMDELSYDRFHENGKDIYRVITSITEQDNEFTWVVAQIPFAPQAKMDYPEVMEYARFADFGRRIFKKGLTGETFYEDNVYYADSATFRIFTYEFIAGDPETCLYEPNSIVVTRDFALKYFGKTEVLDEIIEDSEQTYKITAVIENTPLNSHLQFDALISWMTLEERVRNGNWGNFGVYTYLYTPGLENPAAFEEKLQEIYARYCAEIFEQFGIFFKYRLQNIRDIHLYSRFGSEAETNGDIAYVYIFSAVAFFMLLIASINYMNLATARSMNRAREVGIRKVMGSYRSQLIAQFLTESMVFTIISLLISLAFVSLLMPYLNDMLEKEITMNYLLKPAIFMGIILIILFVGLVGGSYPAFYLSSYDPVDVMKGGYRGKGSGSTLRRVLVIVQFSISIIMIISTWIVYDQLQFLRKKDLGFNKEHILRMNLTNGEMVDKMPVFRDELKKLSGVIHVGTASTTPGSGIGKNLIEVEDANGEMVERGVDLYMVDYDYLTTLDFKFLEGRNFSKEILSDTFGAVIVTRAMLERMNWDTGLQKRFKYGVGDDAPEARVIGVVNDYHHRSLYDMIEPVLFLFRENNRIVHVKLAGVDLREEIREVESAWKKIYPNAPYEYNFLDEEFDQLYRNDQRRGKIFALFSILTIMLACLGLLGLASYTAEQRNKEIGIRKVNGASVNNIVMLVSREFLILVSISVVIACPVAWYFMDNWLQNFAYRTEISVVTFILSAMVALLVSFLTVSFHTIKAALTNPVEALRYE